MISLAENCDESGRTDVVYTCDFLGSGGMVQYAPGIAYNPRVELHPMQAPTTHELQTGQYAMWNRSADGAWNRVAPEPADPDPYAEAKAAFADGELQKFAFGEWFDWKKAWITPKFTCDPSFYRRRPKPDEATTEPSVLQEHANLIAKLDEAEGDAKWLMDIWPNVMDNDGWWGDFGYTPASDRNGIANEAMRQAMTQKPPAPEPKPQAPDGVFEVAPMGRNPRGWGL